MIVIGHRGALHEALENSLESFNKAISGGAARIEFDVQTTKDHHLVIMHDKSLRRTANVSKSVKNLSRAELKAINLLNGEPVPFLDEVLESLLGKVEFNIEIKSVALKDVDLLAKLLKKFNAKNRIIVSSFQYKSIQYLSNTYPKIERACLWPPENGLLLRGSKGQVKLMELTNCKIIHPGRKQITEKFMENARKHDWVVYPYSEMNGAEEKDREKVWTKLRALGVDGFCSNYPSELKQWLKNRS